MSDVGRKRKERNKKENKTPPLLLVGWSQEHIRWLLLPLLSDEDMHDVLCYRRQLSAHTKGGRPRKYCDILCSSICGIALCWQSQSKCWNAFQGTALYWARKYFVFVLMWILFFGLFVCLFVFFHKVKVYSFGHCSWSYSKVVLVLTGFFLFVCLYIHCVFNVPFSMVTEFFSIQPGCIKVQLKDATCPRSSCVSMCECVHIYIFLFFFWSACQQA